jgi:hypothetical protein
MQINIENIDFPDLIEQMTTELANQAELDPTEDNYYNQAKADAEKAKKNIDMVASDVLSPGISELLPLLANSANVTEFATNHLERKKKLDAALSEYVEATQAMSSFAIEHAFEKGLKAGMRLQLELKQWAKG